MEKLFLAKIKNSNDRDCVKYIEFNGFECNHYFGGFHLTGACFCGFEKEFKNIIQNDFESLETILTKKDFEKLFKLNDDLKSLGYGINKDDERYKKGMLILEEYKNTIEKKLLSKENEKLFNKVIADEKEFCKKEYNLLSKDINYIFDNYNLGYKDRAIIGTIFKDFDDMVFEEKFNFGYDKTPYFNDEEFGNDLLNNENYIELSDGKIAYLNY